MPAPVFQWLVWDEILHRREESGRGRSDANACAGTGAGGQRHWNSQEDLVGVPKYKCSFETRSQPSRSHDPLRLFIYRCLALVGVRSGDGREDSSETDQTTSSTGSGQLPLSFLQPPTGTTGSEYSLIISISSCRDIRSIFSFGSEARLEVSTYQKQTNRVTPKTCWA